eukprot:TRINITY_DN1648_c0_g1_i1.p1 TRINITY_DN1648_c0_g1~~TRINITY_DN1648_c0_g1_i1.p1  ORF type:complete len:103 (-),score=28.65 TRINITY_DN1648_c0_g1_i1:230-538(-)
MFCSILLLESVHGWSAPSTHHQTPTILIPISREVSSKLHAVSFSLGFTRLFGENSWEQLKKTHPLETQFLEAFLLLVNKKFAIKEVALKKFLKTKRLQSNTN